MCGIVGAYRMGSIEHVRDMVRMIDHRGPDGSGVADTGSGGLGHTRLAILDVAAGHQPMRHNKVWISFNGEIYNHLDLRRRYLGERQMATQTDTEVVLHLFDRFGPRALEMLEGMFALAIMSDGDLVLARDPLGIKPLYIGYREDTLYFASEIKALSQITDDIREFPPGHWYHSRLGWKRYYSVEDAVSEGELVDSRRQAIPEIRETLRTAVEKRLMSDVPLGISLSGGLDSSIVSVLAADAMEDLNSFAVGMEDSPDLGAARDVASYVGTKHHEYVYTDDEMQKVLPEVIYYLESFDPALVRSAIPNFFLARLASDHVKVFLTGEGADELYAGYAYLEAFEKPQDLQRELIHITDALHNTNLQRADRMSMAHGLEARVPFLDNDSISLALGLPPEWKMRRDNQPEKALLRQAFRKVLPMDIINRPKQKFSKGAGSSEVLAQQAEDTISNAEFVTEQARLQDEWDYALPNKEALYYYRIAQQFYRDEWILPGMGSSRSI